MKIFNQAKNESVVINDEIIVTVLDINDEDVILAIDAPDWIEVRENAPLERSDSMPVRPR
jgi:carbon storage regulator CsrA